MAIRPARCPWAAKSSPGANSLELFLPLHQTEAVISSKKASIRNRFPKNGGRAPMPESVWVLVLGEQVAAPEGPRWHSPTHLIAGYERPSEYQTSTAQRADTLVRWEGRLSGGAARPGCFIIRCSRYAGLGAGQACGLCKKPKRARGKLQPIVGERGKERLGARHRPRVFGGGRAA